MAKQIKAKVEFLKKIRPDIYLLGFNSPYLAKEVNPGQFAHIKVDEKVTILRRPFSIHNVSGNTIYILFRVRGRGTKLLSQYKQGDTLDIIGPLGNGFSVPRPTSNVQRILVAGGMGIAPLVFLAKKLTEIKKQEIPARWRTGKIRNIALLGAKNKNEVSAEQEFRKLGFEVRVATEDGSRGFKGRVTDLLRKILATSPRLQATNKDVKRPKAWNSKLAADIYTCGPKEMFFEIAKVIKKCPAINCQVSFEQFMGCGMGICCGCAIETKSGYKKVCKDGPVFDIKSIW